MRSRIAGMIGRGHGYGIAGGGTRFFVARSNA
jgi:hypothetical protein